MMKNKKGFIFIETIITVVFMSFSLLVLYQIFNTTMINERRRIYYDDVVYVYRTYYLKEFLNSTDIASGRILNSLTNDNYITPIPTTREDVFNYNDDLKSFYEELFGVLKINKVSISKFNFNDIKDCTVYTINQIPDPKCEPLASYSKDEIDYLKILSSSDNYTGYRFIASFNINTIDDKYVTYSAWVKNAKTYFSESTG